MRIEWLGAAAIVALLAGPVNAQQAPMQRYGETDKEKTYNQKQQDKESERAYRRSLDNVPEKAAPSDPWGNTRSAAEPKPEAKAAKTAAPKPKTKTGTTTN